MAVTGLLFGSFNPIHTGHLIIAEYFATRGGCDRVQLVVSPQNPLKHTAGLAADHHRLAMAKLAVRGNPLLAVNDIEYAMPRPSYTVDTLQQLSRRHPQHTFRVLLGSDNFDRFHEWKDWQKILDQYHVLAYRRPGFVHETLERHAQIAMHDQVPLLQISATYIRDCISRGRSIRYLVPDAVRRYIEKETPYPVL